MTQEIKPNSSARQVLRQAHEEAKILGHRYVGTVHILLAVAKLKPELLKDLSYDQIRQQTKALMG